jgi:hypothetical protein
VIVLDRTEGIRLPSTHRTMADIATVRIVKVAEETSKA